MNVLMARPSAETPVRTDRSRSSAFWAAWKRTSAAAEKDVPLHGAPAVPGEPAEDEADGLFGRPAAGSGDPGDRKAEVRAR